MSSKKAKRNKNFEDLDDIYLNMESYITDESIDKETSKKKEKPDILKTNKNNKEKKLKKNEKTEKLSSNTSTKKGEKQRDTIETNTKLNTEIKSTKKSNKTVNSNTEKVDSNEPTQSPTIPNNIKDGEIKKDTKKVTFKDDKINKISKSKQILSKKEIYIKETLKSSDNEAIDKPKKKIKKNKNSIGKAESFQMIENLDDQTIINDDSINQTETEKDDLVTIIESIENISNITESVSKGKLTRKEEKKKEKLLKFETESKNLISESQFSVSQQTSSKCDDEFTGDIKIEKLSISAAGKILLNNTNLIISKGHRYGLVGPNGMGKTTLLTHISSRSIKLPSSLDVLLCEQDIEVDDTPAVEMVINADKKRLFLLNEEKDLLNKISDGDRNAVFNLQSVTEELRAIQANSADSRARRILSGLGFDSEMQTRATNQFSGGWRMRVSLARALFIRPSLLLLDEPTNHLDLNAVIWLENYLADYDKTLLIVSHDQYFLDSVCTDIIHLNNQTLQNYRGNYTSFKKMANQKYKEQIKAYDQQSKQLKQHKMSGKSTKEAEKAVLATSKKKKEKGGKIATEEGVGIAGAIAEQILLKVPREYSVKFTIPNPPKLSPPILGLHNVSFTYPNRKPLFNCLEFGIDMNSRIAIVGPNGVGKSTFLKLLTGRLSPNSGELIRNPRLKIGYFSQHSADQLIMDFTSSEYIQKTFNVDYQQSRKELGRFGLSSHAHTIKMHQLSGGQKSRVAFCDMALRIPDVIILDEPTNNLDIESIDALSLAINQYTGGVIIVSHDARLILETNCQLWIIENQGIDQIEGDFEDYREEVLQLLGENITKRLI